MYIKINKTFNKIEKNKINLNLVALKVFSIQILSKISIKYLNQFYTINSSKISLYDDTFLNSNYLTNNWFNFKNIRMLIHFLFV